MGKKRFWHFLILDLLLAAALVVNVRLVDPPGRVYGLELDRTSYNSAEISWRAAENATSYHVYRSVDGKRFKYIGSTTGTVYEDTSVVPGKVYKYTVSASNKSRRSAPDIKKTVEAAPELDTPELSVDTDNGAVELQFSEVEGATGYEIYRNNEKIAEQEETVFVDEETDNNTEYTYSVKAYMEIDKHETAYSESSKAASAELISPGIIYAELNGDILNFKWAGSDQYTKYELYNGDELLTETDSLTYTIENARIGDTFDMKLVGVSDDTRSPETHQVFTVAEQDMTVEDARSAACDWGVMIADDDSFTYGTGQRAHHFGCYFCGTNIGPNKNKKGTSLVRGHSYEKTYCCNPFVTACYAHGAGDPAMLRLCQSGRGVGMDADDYLTLGNWELVRKTAIEDLQRGDVLVKRTHVALYIGDGQIVQAHGEGWDAGSISVTHLSHKTFNKFEFVMRYNGTGSGTKPLLQDITQTALEEASAETTDENSKDKNAADKSATDKSSDKDADKAAADKNSDKASDTAAADKKVDKAADKVADKAAADKTNEEKSTDKASDKTTADKSSSKAASSQITDKASADKT